LYFAIFNLQWSEATILPFEKSRYFDFAQYKSGFREYKPLLFLNIAFKVEHNPF